MSIKKNNGFSLLEVVISLMILSIALIGLDAMELKSIRESRASYFFSIATNQLQSITEILRELKWNKGLDEQLFIWNKENKAITRRKRVCYRSISNL